MPDLRCAAVNTAWLASSVATWRRYRRSLRSVRDTQSRLLLEYLTANQQTVFGRRHGFAGIRTIEEYQARVPLTTCDELAPLIHRVVNGESNVLTAQQVERLTPSGGSTAARKLIPFTATLRKEFDRAVQCWIVDLFTRMPALIGGPAYWSITPSVAFEQRLTANIPIGFDDDSAYLGAVAQRLARTVMAVPPELSRISDVSAFQYATVLCLLHAAELRLISVWHPSFLERLLDVLEMHRDRLAHDVAGGTFSPPGQPSPDERPSVAGRFAANPRRAEVVRKSRPGDAAALWPHLALISAWADGHSSGAARQLAQRFDHVPVQAKGLLASEGVVTIPFAGRHPLAIRSHFFEFEEADGAGVRLADELESGQEYRVVLTTGGGLYRYRLGDRVRVDGYVQDTPSLQFVGKEDHVSDWFGEKLTDGFVAGVLRTLLAGHGLPPFAMLAPERQPSGFAYTLFVAGDAIDSRQLETRLDQALRQNPHYGWCRDLGQISRPRVRQVGAGAAQAYIDACAARGQRIGDVKPVALRSDTGWEHVLPSAERAGAVPC